MMFKFDYAMQVEKKSNVNMNRAYYWLDLAFGNIVDWV